MTRGKSAVEDDHFPSRTSAVHRTSRRQLLFQGTVLKNDQPIKLLAKSLDFFFCGRFRLFSGQKPAESHSQLASRGWVPRFLGRPAIRSLSLLAFEWLVGIAEFDPLKVKLLAGGLRTARKIVVGQSTQEVRSRCRGLLHVVCCVFSIMEENY